MDRNLSWYIKWLGPHAIGGYLIGRFALYFLDNDSYLSFALMLLTCMVYSSFISWIQINFTNLHKKD